VAESRKFSFSKFSFSISLDAKTFQELGKDLEEKRAGRKGNVFLLQPFYAMKCNNDLMLLKTLGELGAGFDCASKREISVVRPSA
jgi:diaminopimelate decarboxylase